MEFGTLGAFSAQFSTLLLEWAASAPLPDHASSAQCVGSALTHYLVTGSVGDLCVCKLAVDLDRGTAMSW